MLRTAGAMADRVMLWAIPASDLERSASIVRDGAAHRPRPPELIWAPLVRHGDAPQASIMHVAVYASLNTTSAVRQGWGSKRRRRSGRSGPGRHGRWRACRRGRGGAIGRRPGRCGLHSEIANLFGSRATPSHARLRLSVKSSSPTAVEAAVTVARMKYFEAPVLLLKSKFPASSAKTYFRTRAA